MRRLFSTGFIAIALLLALAVTTAVRAQDASGQGTHFAVDRVNPGLSPPGPLVNRDTPRAMMETFRLAARLADWESAAHTMDLSSLAEVDQAIIGPILARQLGRVLERALWLDWDSLPDRPDALLDSVATKHPLAGEAQRSIRLGIVELREGPIPIRVARLKPEEGDPVWVFSKQTVENIPILYERFGPTVIEQAMPQALQSRAFWTLAWWEVIALPLLLLGASGAAFAVHRIIGLTTRRKAQGTARAMLLAARMPVALAVFVASFTIAEQLLFTFSGAVNALLDPLQVALIVIAVVALGVRMVDGILDRVARLHIDELSDPDTQEERSIYTNLSAARRAAIVLAFAIGTALVLVQTNISATLGFSLLASASLIGLVLVFAARAILADIMASLQIAIAKTARIGDAVLYDDMWCYVEKIAFTHLQLRSWDRRRLIVPVSQFVANTFENWSKDDPSLLKPVLLKLDHRADIDALRGLLQEFVDTDEDVLEPDMAKVQVIDQDAAGLDVRFYVSAADPATAWDLHCRLREHLVRGIARLEAEQSPEEADRAAYFPRERETQISGTGE